MKSLVIGSRVHCILHGGKDGVVYAIHGEQKPESVSTMGGFIQMGGSADFDIVWENGSFSHRIPEAIIHGVQWRTLDGIASAEEIVAMKEFAVAEEARKKAEQKKQEEEFAAAVEAMKVNPEFAGLTKTGSGLRGSKLVAKNLRVELKKNFPGVKFSIKMDGYDCVLVGWSGENPSKENVEAITKKYEGGHFDGMNDMYVHSRSPFTEVYGSTHYIFFREVAA